MKQEIQLYVNGQRVDLFQDETISITSSIKNTKDIGSIFMTYSQGFNVPASKNNNKIFKHYYENSIVNGFDARLKVEAEIEINDTPFKKGKVQLNAVKLKDNMPYSYDLTFFDDTISLKDILGDDLLSDLDFSEYNDLYNPTWVRLWLSNGKNVNGIPDAIICPMISAEQRWYYNSSENIEGTGNLWYGGPADTALRGAYWDNFKYAIRLYCIIKKIEEHYPEINFSENDFFSQTNLDFYNLYMWLHRERGVVVSDKYKEYITGFEQGTQFGFSTTDYGFALDKSGMTGFNLSLHLNTGATSEKYDINILDNITGEVAFSEVGLTGDQIVGLSSLDSGQYKIQIVYENQFNIFGDGTTNQTYLYAYTAFEQNQQPIVNIAEYELLSSINLGADFIFEVQQNFPKIKVIDFITGMFKMFNLVAYKEGDVIRVRHLDEYYQNFDETFDLNKYVDISESEVKPNKLYKTIRFGYEGLDTYLAEKHNEQFNYEWATEEYSLDDNYEGENYEVKLPFEHLKLERLYDQDVDQTTILWGWMVDDLKEDKIDGDAYLGKPYIFYAIKQQNADPIRINTGIEDNPPLAPLDDYWIPSNSRSLSSSQTINFKAEVNEYDETLFTKTLFDTYYRNYIESIYDYRARITKLTAYLPLKIITKLKLNDLLIIGDKYYRIINMSINLNTGKTDFELQYKYEYSVSEEVTVIETFPLDLPDQQA